MAGRRLGSAANAVNRLRGMKGNIPRLGGRKGRFISGRGSPNPKFRANARAHARANSVFGRAATKLRTGPALGNRFTGQRVQALRSAGRVAGRAAGRAAGSTTGRHILATGVTIGHSVVSLRRAQNKLKAQGYTRAQINKARGQVNRQVRRNGRGGIIAGTFLTGVGAQMVGRGSRKGTAVGAGLIAGGQLLQHRGLKRYNSEVARRLGAGERSSALKGGRSKGSAQRAKGMSRSQAARIAANARWHGGGGRRKR